MEILTTLILSRASFRLIVELEKIIRAEILFRSIVIDEIVFLLVLKDTLYL